MKKLFLASLIFMFTGCDTEQVVKPTPKPAPVVTNAICPVTGDPIDEGVAPVVVGPYTVRFHSLRCRKKFVETPAEQQTVMLNSVFPKEQK